MPGTIVSDPDHYNYMEYLIGRLADFRNAGSSFGHQRTGKVHKGVIRNQIKNKWGALPKDLPLDAWENLVSDLKTKILNTTLGRNLRSKSQRCFHSFEEHIEQTRTGKK